MLRVFVTALILIINFVCQTTLFQYIEIVGVTPNTALLIVMSFAILRNDIEGAIIGFFYGLLMDVYFADFWGLHALLYMLMGFFAAKPFKHFFRENFLLPLLLVAVCSIVYECAYYITNFLLRGRIDFMYYLRGIMLPRAVYTTVLLIPIYRGLYALNNLLEARERKKGRE